MFYYLIAFMKELLRHSTLNKVDAKVIGKRGQQLINSTNCGVILPAAVFGSVMIRSPDVDTAAGQKATPRQSSSASAIAQKNIDQKKGNFVYYFLVNDFDI